LDAPAAVAVAEACLAGVLGAIPFFLSC
jgi:hypothetical protein